MSETSFDVLVIGAGVMGNSIAYHLARKGQRVLVTERSQIAVTPAASWASAGGIRRQGRHPAEALLAIEAIERWSSLEQELDADVHYHQGGNLRLAETETDVTHLVTFVHQQQEMGFADVRLIDRSEALALVPGLNEHVLAGSYSPRDGQADPALTTQAFASAAERLGAVYQKDTPVLALLLQGERITGVRTAQGELHVGHVVLAAGAWSDELATSIGITLPIRTRALQMLLSTPGPAGLVQPVLSAVQRSLSLKQLPDGAFLLGGGWPGDPTADRRSYRIRPESIQSNWTTAYELLPIVAQQSIARVWCGLEAQSADDLPFIGSLSGLDGLTFALGFSGHGFALSPAVGRCVADHIAGQPTPELTALSPDRIIHSER